LAHPASQKPVPSAENANHRFGPDVHPKRAVHKATLDSRGTLSSSAHQAHLKDTLVRESSHKALHGVTRTATAEKALKSKASAMTHGLTIDNRGMLASSSSSSAHETHQKTSFMRESHHESRHRAAKTAMAQKASKSRTTAETATGCKRVLAYSEGSRARANCAVQSGARMCFDGDCTLTTGNGFHVVTFSFADGMTSPRTRQVFNTADESVQPQMTAVLDAVEDDDFCMIACSDSCAPAGRALTGALIGAMGRVGALQAANIGDGDSYLLMATRGQSRPSVEIIGNALCPEEELTLPCPTTTTTITVTSYTKRAGRVSAFILACLLASLH